jgi:hypothetical protein
MEHLPPVGWADVATNRDVDHAVVLMKRDFDAFRTEIHHELDGIKHELEGVRADLAQCATKHELEGVRADLAQCATKHELEGVRADLAQCATKHDLEELRAEFKMFRFQMQADFATFTASIERSLRRQTYGMVAAFTTFATLLIAVNALLAR